MTEKHANIDLWKSAPLAEIDNPHPKNPRKIPAEDSDEIRTLDASLEHDYFDPLIWNKRNRMWVSGHVRAWRMRVKGYTHLDVVVVDYDEETHLARMLAANAHSGTNDDDKLASLLTSLRESQVDPVLALMASLPEAPVPPGEADAEPQIDRAEELNKIWQVKPGSVWQIGSHRLMCGSCLTDDLAKLLGVQVPSFVFADAPYGINIVSGGGKVSTGLPPGPGLSKGGHAGARSAGTKPSGGGQPGGRFAGGKVGSIHRGMKTKPIIESNTYAPVIGDENTDVAKASFSKIYALFPKAMHVWWGANHFSDVFPDSSCWIVWDKDNGASFFADAELAYCSDDTSVRIFKHKWNGLLKDSERGEKRVHPNQKPVALAVWCFENYGEPEDVILDPFCGSGCSMLAAQNLGRICYGMEISPGYCAVILDRMQRAFPDLEIKRVE